MKISTYQNVFVTRSGIGMKMFQLIPETIHHYPGKKRHFYIYALVQFFLRKKIKLKGNYFIIHNHWCPGYFHWLTEALPRMLAATNHVKDYTLILPETFKGFSQDSLQALYHGKIFWIPQDKNLIIQKLLVPENPRYCGNFDRTTFAMLRDLFSKFFTNQVFGPAVRKIYISRWKSGRRKVANENEVVTVLTDWGFEIINFEDLRFSEQVQLMVSTKVLFSIHGAGLSNMLFMPKGGWVVELQKKPSPSQDQNELYKDLATTLDLQYRPIFCPSDEQSIYIADIVLDINILKNFLNEHKAIL